ncbi:hypothetical protein SRS16CHR_04313 [Variovorax sp. SRS16]|uniref:DUF5675 family protein n=1 Tax=Variovorax sp. SRS16 TaxID=282217 RepID=UPI0013181D59|nr:DUF5675 family protein [Variovorax sp. SRS16]VTU28673.1 hypothetical protein SRS16CHR_04313 [Variovorax sp. SRS16]
MHIEIIRDKSKAPSAGEFGMMLLDGSRICATCEHTWAENNSDVSCISEGDYELRAINSPAHGHTSVFHNPALDVYAAPRMIPAGKHDRSLYEIHVANWPFQLRGCVAVGQRIVEMKPHGLGVNASTATFAMLMGKVGLEKGLTATIRSQ